MFEQMELKEFVVMKDGTIIHMKTGGPPVIDIRYSVTDAK